MTATSTLAHAALNITSTLRTSGHATPNHGSRSNTPLRVRRALPAQADQSAPLGTVEPEVPDNPQVRRSSSATVLDSKAPLTLASGRRRRLSVTTFGDSETATPRAADAGQQPSTSILELTLAARQHLLETIDSGTVQSHGCTAASCVLELQLPLSKYAVVGPDATIFQAVTQVGYPAVQCLVVAAPGVTHVLSKEDMERLSRYCHDPATDTLGSFLAGTPPEPCVFPSATVAAAAGLLLEGGAAREYLPVVEEATGSFLGLLSRKDIATALLGNRQDVYDPVETTAAAATTNTAACAGGGGVGPAGASPLSISSTDAACGTASATITAREGAPATRAATDLVSVVTHVGLMRRSADDLGPPGAAGTTATAAAAQLLLPPAPPLPPGSPSALRRRPAGHSQSARYHHHFHLQHPHHHHHHHAAAQGSDPGASSPPSASASPTLNQTAAGRHTTMATAATAVAATATTAAAVAAAPAASASAAPATAASAVSVATLTSLDDHSALYAKAGPHFRAAATGAMTPPALQEAPALLDLGGDRPGQGQAQQPHQHHLQAAQQQQFQQQQQQQQGQAFATHGSMDSAEHGFLPDTLRSAPDPISVPVPHGLPILSISRSGWDMLDNVDDALDVLGLVGKTVNAEAVGKKLLGDVAGMAAHIAGGSSGTGWAFKYLYDGDCSICRTFQAVIEKLDGGLGRVAFVDIAGQGFNPLEHGGINYKAAMETLHILSANGQVFKGVTAVIKLLAAVDPEVAAHLGAVTAVLPLLSLGYMLVSKNRHTLSAAWAQILRATRADRALFGRDILDGWDERVRLRQQQQQREEEEEEREREREREAQRAAAAAGAPPPAGLGGLGLGSLRPLEALGSLGARLGMGSGRHGGARAAGVDVAAEGVPVAVRAHVHGHGHGHVHTAQQPQAAK